MIEAFLISQLISQANYQYLTNQNYSKLMPLANSNPLQPVIVDFPKAKVSSILGGLQPTCDIFGGEGRYYDKCIWREGNRLVSISYLIGSPNNSQIIFWNFKGF